MKEQIAKIHDLIITCLQFTTAFCIYYLISLRFFPHTTNYIFENPSFTKGYFYLFLLLSNFFLLYITIISYLEKKIDQDAFFSVLGIKISNWIENSYRKVVIVIGDLDPPRWVTASIYFIMEQYPRLPIKFLRFFEYIPRLLFVTHFSIEVIFFNTLHYCFYTIYLLLFTFLHRSMLFFAWEWQNNTQRIVSDSLTYDKWHSYIDKDGNTNLGWNIRLSEKNKYYDNLDEALAVDRYVGKEIFLLNRVQKYVYPPFWYLLIIRLLYISSFIYILYLFPLPIISSLLSEISILYLEIYNFLPISFIVILISLSLLLTNKTKSNTKIEKVYSILSQENEHLCNYVTDFDLIYENENESRIYSIGVLYSKNTYNDSKERSICFSNYEHLLFHNPLPIEVKNNPKLIETFLIYLKKTNKKDLKEFIIKREEYNQLFQKVLRELKELNIPFKVALTPEERLLTPLNKYILLNKEKK